MLHLTLVRHASTAWNRERRYQGWGDPPLSVEGRAEAERLGARLRGERFDGVVASDLRRSVETARLALPGAPLETDARLREMDFGAWDGLTYDECVRSDAARVERWIVDPTRECPPEGERFDAFAARVDAGVDRLPREGRVLLVAHGGPLRRIVARALGLAWGQVVLMEAAACGITRLVLHPEGGHLLCWNDTAHLDGWRAT